MKEIIKPKRSVVVIGESIKWSTHSHMVQLKEKQRLGMEHLKKYIFYLESGCVNIYRLNDGILTITVQGPALIGLTQLKSDYVFHYIRSEFESTLWRCRKDSVISLLDKNKLWGNAFEHMTYIANLYHAKEEMGAGKNIKFIVQ